MIQVGCDPGDFGQSDSNRNDIEWWDLGCNVKLDPTGFAGWVDKEVIGDFNKTILVAWKGQMPVYGGFKRDGEERNWTQIIDNTSEKFYFKGAVGGKEVGSRENGCFSKEK